MAQVQVQEQVQEAQAQVQEAQVGVNNYTILRFNFSEDITTRIAYFANLHQFEDRQTYKQNWHRWCEEHQRSVATEIIRLEQNGYTGDVAEKMYKAGRYYFRKKGQEEQKQGKQEGLIEDMDSKQEQKQGRRQGKYTTMNKAILEEMDNHIRTSMRNNRAYTPAGGYTDFCERYGERLAIETERLKWTERLDELTITNKIKKTYKNRYFMVTR